ncbi:MAG: UDP-3-O-(3-hydroxymyristoyl)glucosamine N-acyltransferase [Candidatus Acidiferrales bacterium]
MARTAAELASYLHAEIEGESKAPILSLSNPENATPEDLIYVENETFRERAQASRSRCVLAPPGIPISDKAVIRVAAPKLAFAKAAAWLLRARRAPVGVHPAALVSTAARIAKDASIGPFVVVEEEASIASGAVIDAFCFVGRGAMIGEDSHLYPHVTLYEGVRLGRRVAVHSGTVIGGDGFGYVFGDGKHWKFPQVGTVEIGDDVEIGCNTTVDRGSLDTTRIAQGVKIDNLVQIGHNVQIGRNSIIAAQVGISGSSTLGAGVMLGGQAGLGDHCALEDDAIVGGQAGILPGKTIRAGQTVWGTPARPLAKFKEQFAWISRLPEIGKRLRNFK